MASPRAIAATLAFLHELYPTRDITPATSDAWALTFAEWTDADLTAAAQKAAATPGRTFFPTPGEIAESLVATPPVINGAAILRQIEKLSAYSPQVGMIAPPVATVRGHFGEQAADAYAMAGAHRCFSNDDTTRSIAQREFQKHLEEYAASPNEVRHRIESGAECRQIGQPQKQTGTESIAAIVQRALPKGTAA
jgi:hypothetical protein